MFEQLSVQHRCKTSKMAIIWFILLHFGIIKSTSATYDIQKICMEETTNEKHPIIWPASFSSNKNVDSKPLCLTSSKTLITRHCNSSVWVPKYDEVSECASTQSRPLQNPCPPDFLSIVDANEKLLFCYQYSSPQSWNYPCKSSGSSETIFDLDEDELQMLKPKLKLDGNKYVWLPAKRIIPYGPVGWMLPGKWGEIVKFDNKIKYTKLPIVQGCLLLDLEKFTVKTENCSYQYPSICIFKGKHLLPLHCPPGYSASRYGYSLGKCYGMEFEHKETGWEQFRNERCETPMKIRDEIENYYFQEMSQRYHYDKYCWISLLKDNTNASFRWYPEGVVSFVNWDAQTNFSMDFPAYGAVDDKFRWTLWNQTKGLKCMACQYTAEKKDIDLKLHYAPEVDKLVLTIYNPRGIWKADSDDPGVQCFSNAKGFVETVDVECKPTKKIKFFLKSLVEEADDKIGTNDDVEKSVYEFHRISDSPGEYWCIGQNSIDFDLEMTQKVLVASKESEEHRFVLKLEVRDICQDLTTCNPNWAIEATKLKFLLMAEDVYIMEVESINSNGTAVILYHVNIEIDDFQRCYGPINCKIVNAYLAMEFLCENVFQTVEEYTFIYLRSTAFCMPVVEQDLHWEITPIGDITAPREFCMQSTGLPVTRLCGGSFVHGGQWKTIEGECSRNYEPTNRTTFLYSLAKGQADMETTSTFLTHDMIVILDDKADMIPADVYFLSLSLKMIVEISDQNASLIELGDAANFAAAIDSIMNIEESCLHLAQTMNSSNIMLESLDQILTKIAHNESDVLLNSELGVNIVITPQFVLQMCNPSLNNITGLALRRKDNIESLSFMDMEVIPLTANTTVNEIIALDGLEIATWLSTDLLNKFNADSNATVVNMTFPNVIIDVFYSDVVFQETKPEKNQVNSRVVSVTVPGYDSELPFPIPIIYRRLNNSDNLKRECAYWDFHSPHQTSLGEWSKKGCYFVASYGDLDLCACVHLTHFAQLVLGFKGNDQNTGETIIQQYHGRALNAITLVGCSLSLVGVSGIAVTAMIFKKWRQKPGTKVLLQLSAAIALQSLMMVSQDGLYESETHCVILGVLLHYSVLAAFMWMLMTALLQFARYVKVLGVQRPARFMIKFSLIGWGVPMIPIAILLLVDHTAYLPSYMSTFIEHDTTALCYPQGLGLYLSVILPVGCIVVTNLVVFILVMRSIMVGPDGKRRADPEIVISQLRLSVLLFFLLGLSWIFGLLAIIGGRILFSYLFCLTATLQGFVLFVYFVVCDPATRVLWVSLVRERSTSSKETTMQSSTRH